MADNEVYQGEISDNESVSGLKGYSQSKRKKTPSYLNAAQETWGRASAAPWSRPLSEVAGQTDYGNSMYDFQDMSISDVQNLEDTRARVQPFIHKLGAGVGTFLAKTGTATVGGTIGLANGIYQAFSEQRFSALYDNAFNESLNKINEDIDDTFRVYVSDQEKNGSFFDQTIGSASFWTKSFLGDGLSFTAGAILSSYAMGGLGSAIGKLGSVISKGVQETGALAKAVNAIKVLAPISNESADAANLLGKIGSKALGAIDKTKKLGSIATRMMAYSGYEAGVEASDLLRVERDKFKSDFESKYGSSEDPNNQELYAKELAKFNEFILPKANALFAGNLALVSASSLATIPSVFGAGLKNAVTKAAGRSILKDLVKEGAETVAKEGVETVAKEGAESAAKIITKKVLEQPEKTLMQKVGRVAYNVAKPGFSEGIVEEGGQNLMKTTLENYIDKTYSDKSARNVYTMMNSLGNAFEQAYATKDGWKEILSGILIGSMGAPNLSKFGRIEIDEETKKKKFKPNLLNEEESWWTGGILEGFQSDKKIEDEAQRQRDAWKKYKVEDVVDYVVKNLNTNQGIGENIRSAIFSGASADELNSSMEKGDFASAKSAEYDMLHQYVKSRIDSGYADTIYDELISPIEKMTNKEFAESFDYPVTLSDSEISNRKKHTIETFKNKVEDVRKAINTADSITEHDTSSEEGRLRRDTLIYGLSTLKNVNDRMDLMKKTIKSILGGGHINYEHKQEEYDRLREEKLKLVDNLKSQIESESDVNKKDLLKQKLSRVEKDIDALDRSSVLSKTMSDALTSQAGIDELVENKLKTVNGAKSLEQLIDLFEQFKEKGPDSDANAKELSDSLKDMQYLLRRKEETLELYETAKNPINFNKFIRSNRIMNLQRERLEKMINDAVDNQNEEVDNATNAIDNNKNPFDSGATAETISSITNEKNRIKQLKIKDGIEGLIADINKMFGTSIENAEQLDEVVDALSQSDNPNDRFTANEIKKKINKVVEDQLAPVEDKSNDINVVSDKPVGDLSDNVEDFGDTNTKFDSLDSIDTIEEMISEDESAKNKTHYIGNKLRDAFRHIAYLARKFEYVHKNNVVFKKDLGLNEKASKLILDFTKVNVGTEITFEVLDDFEGEIYIGGQETPVKWSEFKSDLKKNTAKYNSHVPIAIKVGNEIIGYLHEMQFMDPKFIAEQEGNVKENKKQLALLRSFIIKNNGHKSVITYRSHGKLIRSSEIKPTNDNLKDKNLIVTTLNKSSVTKPNGFNGIIINEHNLPLAEGIVSLLPVNQDKVSGLKKYVACPLAPQILKLDYVNSIVDVVSLYMKSITGELSEADAKRFDIIADSIDKNLKGLGTDAKPLSFNVKTLNGLRNYISLFTYVRKTVKPEMDINPKDKNKIGFAIDSMVTQNGDSFFVISFGSPGNVISYKISTSIDENGVKKSFVSKKNPGQSNYVGKVVDATSPTGSRVNLKMADFSDFKNEIEYHLQRSYFYSNKGLIGKKIKIPTINVDTKSTSNIVKLSEEMDYSEHLKDNTETNLTSYDIGTKDNPNHIYTVQANVAFDTSGMKENIPIAKEGYAPGQRISKEQDKKESKKPEEAKKEEKPLEKSVESKIVSEGPDISHINYSEDFDLSVSENSVDNAQLKIQFDSDVDLEESYNKFFINELTREQQAMMRNEVANGNIKVKCK